MLISIKLTGSFQQATIKRKKWRFVRKIVIPESKVAARNAQPSIQSLQRTRRSINSDMSSLSTVVVPIRELDLRGSFVPDLKLEPVYEFVVECDSHDTT